jgi:NAD+ kinase
MAEKGVPLSEMPPDMDLVIVLGGDGTMLAVARAVSPKGVPLLGINLGRLGFLTELDTDEIETAIPEILKGNYFLDSRMMLEVKLKGEKFSYCALNEVALDRGGCPRIVVCDVSISGESMASFAADGVIVSTPTGSTAYSMAAGGTIIQPDARAFQIIPLSAYTLAIRPVVVDGTESIRIAFVGDKENPPRMSLDGQVVIRLEEKGEVAIKKARFSAHFVHYYKRSFFEVLRRKLGWAAQPKK